MITRYLRTGFGLGTVERSLGRVQRRVGTVTCQQEVLNNSITAVLGQWSWDSGLGTSGLGTREGLGKITSGLGTVKGLGTRLGQWSNWDSGFGTGSWDRVLGQWSWDKGLGTKGTVVLGQWSWESLGTGSWDKGLGTVVLGESWDTSLGIVLSGQGSWDTDEVLGQYRTVLGQ